MKPRRAQFYYSNGSGAATSTSAGTLFACAAEAAVRHFPTIKPRQDSVTAVGPRPLSTRVITQRKDQSGAAATIHFEGDTTILQST
jgi:hypothetical protein